MPFDAASIRVEGQRDRVTRHACVGSGPNPRREHLSLGPAGLETVVRVYGNPGFPTQATGSEDRPDEPSTSCRKAVTVAIGACGPATQPRWVGFPPEPPVAKAARAQRPGAVQSAPLAGAA